MTWMADDRGNKELPETTLGVTPAEWQSYDSHIDTGEDKNCTQCLVRLSDNNDDTEMCKCDVLDTTVLCASCQHCSVSGWGSTSGLRGTAESVTHPCGAWVDIKQYVRNFREKSANCSTKPQALSCQACYNQRRAASNTKSVASANYNSSPIGSRIYQNISKKSSSELSSFNGHHDDISRFMSNYRCSKTSECTDKYVTSEDTPVLGVHVPDPYVTKLRYCGDLAERVAILRQRKLKEKRSNTSTTPAVRSGADDHRRTRAVTLRSPGPDKARPTARPTARDTARDTTHPTARDTTLSTAHPTSRDNALVCLQATGSSVTIRGSPHGDQRQSPAPSPRPDGLTPAPTPHLDRPPSEHRLEEFNLTPTIDRSNTLTDIQVKTTPSMRFKRFSSSSQYLDLCNPAKITVSNHDTPRSCSRRFVHDPITSADILSKPSLGEDIIGREQYQLHKSLPTFSRYRSDLGSSKVTTPMVGGSRPNAVLEGQRQAIESVVLTRTLAKPRPPRLNCTNIAVTYLTK